MKKRSASANAVYFILLFTLVGTFTALILTSGPCETTGVTVVSVNMHPVLNGKGEKTRRMLRPERIPDPMQPLRKSPDPPVQDGSPKTAVPAISERTGKLLRIRS